ncbi:response regulator transcription factor [Chitinophaga arvensicola]|uniref:DNA-binding response regulator, OmpR family, contains REC and winged-helix (WHTH) domain n=1 Tax=Chitinophaga arvensicola TaxID=29529 RepID=A0A1I0SE35_9BACT|nr:response regulator transcription factor [Chitinophaga arvensicola]SEW57490.1 DNA-binding response regulator, OmpR family, contains REC and winged-helix (wHTH) domain [Chitinophaga arvensicola]
MKARILLVEAVVGLRNLIRQRFEKNEFEVDVLSNGKQAYEVIRKDLRYYNILLIDAVLPGMDGFELAEKIAEMGGGPPFVLITAANKDDRIRGLKIGAADCLSMPLDVDELALRIRNIIRRITACIINGGSIIERGDVQLNKDLQVLHVGTAGVGLQLSTNESALLNFFFNNENRLVSRKEILTYFNSNDIYLGERSLDVFIFRLRKLLEASRFLSIETVYGAGLILSVRDAVI